MRSWSLLLTACMAVPVLAQTPITDARQLAVGTSVTVRGIVTNGGELGGLRFVQDATGGVALFPGTGSASGFAPPRGADLSVTGTVKLYNGLLELDPITAYTVHSTGNALPAAQVVAPAQLSEANEGELVRVNGCVFDDGGDVFAGGTWAFTSNGQDGIIFLRAGHPLNGSTIPTGAVDLVAIVSQYSTSDPPVGGYQLLLRTEADLIAATDLTITGPVQQTDIVPTGFTLRWPTNIGASSEARYGTTPAFGSYALLAGTNTAHVLPIDGLQPATFYYAQAFSVLGNDTAWAPTGLYSTASPVPGAIRVYFTLPVDNSVSLGTPAITLENTVDDTIRAYIDGAQHTIDYAVYNTTNSSIATALNNAADDGVQVRVIAEGSNSNSALDNLDPTIPVLFRENAEGSGMHNKFLVIDADDAPNAHLITGSTNCTNQSFYEDANNLVIVDDQALARCYRAEFNEMWGAAGTVPNVANSRFGPAKLENTPHLFNIGGTLVESRFSPSDYTTDAIEASLRTADHSIEFALFALTLEQLTTALIDMEAEPGVTVRGLLEGSDMSVWNYEELLDGGVDVRPDNMTGAYLHHKYAIVDRAQPGSDPLVVTGSHNWSYNAETYNDENTLIIHSATVADQFYQEWYARWTFSVGIDGTADAHFASTLWPNPVNGTLHVGLVTQGGGDILLRITDAAGRTVHTEQRTTSAGPQTWTMPVDGLAPGGYVLILEQDGHRAHRGFVRD